MADSLEGGVLEEAVRKFNERVENYKETLASGRCSDYSEYKFITGAIKGLAEAMSDVQDIIEKYEIT